MALTPPDRKQLTNLISDIFTGRDTNGRENILTQVSLNQFIDNINLSGSSDSAASAVVTKLEPYDEELAMWPGYTPLGALLWYILNRDDLPPAKHKVAAKLVIKYQLITDADFLAELRNRFPDEVPPAPQPNVAEPGVLPDAAGEINAQELQKALLSGYNHSSLTIMLKFEMDIDLDNIVGSGNFNNVTFELIRWATQRGKLQKLLQSAYKDNPGNPLIRVLAQKHGLA
ncbi:MAG: effector-associated domain EAD1-containing protein [Chloroflexota bacterium]